MCNNLKQNTHSELGKWLYRRHIVIDVTTRRGTQLFRAKSDSPRRRALSFHSPALLTNEFSRIYHVMH